MKLVIILLYTLLYVLTLLFPLSLIPLVAILFTLCIHVWNAIMIERNVKHAYVYRISEKTHRTVVGIFSILFLGVFIVSLFNIEASLTKYYPTIPFLMYLSLIHREKSSS